MAFADTYGQWGVVLGASEGLGEAYAHGLAERGLSVVVAARRAEVLGEVSRAVSGHGVETRAVPLDLADPSFLEVLRQTTDDLDVGLVVYNGAAGYVGALLEQGIESMRAVVNVNCLGPLLVCDHFGRRLAERGRGGIVLMSSAAGLAGSAYNSAYAASKAFELVLGESLWAEWGSTGVDVLSVIGPAIDTPTFRRSMPETANLPEPPAPPAQVVVAVLDALGTTPSMVPSKKTGEALAFLGTLPRQTQVEALSATHRSLFERHERHDGAREG